MIFTLKDFLDFTNYLGWYLAVVGQFYLIPYLIRKGWGDAENKTKKVCDMCFRDIKKWNQLIKEHQKNESKKS